LLASARRWHGSASLADAGAAAASTPWSRLAPSARQEAMLAIVAALAPPVVLLDDPDAGAPGARAALVRWVLARRERGQAVVLATTDEDLLARVTDRTLIVFDGAEHASGPTDEVLPAAVAEAARRPL